MLLIQLQPQEGQCLGAVVVVGDGHGAGDTMVNGIQGGIDVVIGGVLPIPGAGRTVGSAVFVTVRRVK